jgi:prepilin-type N-terminal cleavage/methylation domain-containing protein
VRIAVLSLAEDKRRPQAGLTLIEILAAMVILGVLTTMLIMGWVNLQRASAFSIQSNNARATARDALSRISTELRDAQPATLPTASPAPTYVPELLDDAQPMSATFLSVYNQPGAGDDVDGDDSARLLTRIWLDTGGASPQKTLYWQRDTNGSGTIDPGDRRIILARNVVNDSVEDASEGTEYTAVFLYGYRASSFADIEWTDNDDASLDLSTVVSVRVRLIIDANLGRAPGPIDVTTTVLPRNAVAY